MIEPLGSVTVLQAEPYKAQVQPAPVETATEGAKIDSQPMVDNTTKAVESADEKQQEGFRHRIGLIACPVRIAERYLHSL